MDFITTARPLVSCPILRKDFIIDDYQLFQAKAIGADAVLLIAADLTKAECASLAKTAHELQLETLLEVHSEQELDYAGESADTVKELRKAGFRGFLIGETFMKTADPGSALNDFIHDIIS